MGSPFTEYDAERVGKALTNMILCVRRWWKNSFMPALQLFLLNEPFSYDADVCGEIFGLQ